MNNDDALVKLLLEMPADEMIDNAAIVLYRTILENCESADEADFFLCTGIVRLATMTYDLMLKAGWDAGKPACLNGLPVIQE